MKTKLIKILAPIALISLTACGQTPVSQANAAPSSAAAKPAAPVQGKVGEALKARLEKIYESQGLKVISVSETPIQEIGRASCRERVKISAVGVPIKK